MSRATLSFGKTTLLALLGFQCVDLYSRDQDNDNS